MQDRADHQLDEVEDAGETVERLLLRAEHLNREISRCLEQQHRQSAGLDRIVDMDLQRFCERLRKTLPPETIEAQSQAAAIAAALVDAQLGNQLQNRRSPRRRHAYI